MKKVYLISSILYLVLGLIHTGFTFAEYSEMSEAAFWFAGTGIGLINLGFLNIIALQKKITGCGAVIMLNTISLSYMLGLLYMMSEPQLIASIVLSVLMVAGSVQLFRDKL